MKNDFARKHGIPKMFRQYSKRYGVGVEELVRVHAQTRDVSLLDHWRDRIERAKKASA